jgi:hypothetical protein
MGTINTLIISGCLAKQDFQTDSNGKIDFVFHHFLNEMLDEKYKTELNINIMRYERYNTSYDRFLQYVDKYNPDLIIFQLRHYHFLRLIGLVSYFIDNSNTVRRDLNLPFFRPFSNEINDPFLIYINELTVGKKIQIESPDKFKFNILKHISNLFNSDQNRIILEKMNRILGMIIGNYYFAINEYYKLLGQIIEFSKQKKLELIFLSLSPKPIPLIDYQISKMLNSSTKKYIESQGCEFIDVFRKYSEKGEYLYLDDNLHLNTTAHHFISEQLFPVVENYILKH